MSKRLIYPIPFIVLLSIASSVQALTITTAVGNGADTYLSNDGQSGNYGPDSVHGADGGLAVRNYEGVRQKFLYIRFDLTGISGDLTGATVSFNVTNSNRNRNWLIYGLVDGADDLWDEATTSYSNAPGVLPAALGSFALNETKLQLLGTINVLENTPTRDTPNIYTSNTADLNLDSFLSSDTNKLLTFAVINENSDNDASYWVTAKEDNPDLAPMLTLPNAVRSLPPSASEPNPGDGIEDVSCSPVLSWTPGAYADKHDVYFGTVFDDVNEGVPVVSGQDPNTYTPPGRLEWGTTYYWRIDEVNDAHPDKLWRGDIWSFTVEPFAYQIGNITATASSSVIGQGPENAINGSGLDANDLHSTVETDMWLSDECEPGEAWIRYDFDKVYKLHQMWVWNHNLTNEDILGFGLKEITIEYSLTGEDGAWTLLDEVPDFNQAPGVYDGVSEYAHNTTVDFRGAAVRYVRITAESHWSILGDLAKQYGLSEVRFFYIPVRARYPSPPDEATGVGPDVVLSWRAGREAAMHDVYLSSSGRAVTQGTIIPESVPGNGCESSYDAGTLQLGKTYYWKVNEVNEAQAPATWQGDVWSFVTPEYLVVDDMESYGDGNTPSEPGSRIWYEWKDGYGWRNPSPGNHGNGSGAIVDVAGAIVNTGSQSLRCDYDNDGIFTNVFGEASNPYYSQVERTFDDPQDWSKAGVKTLALYFYGDPNNDATSTEQLYVKVNGAKVIYDGDLSDITQARWHEWNIPLADFGVDLTNITRLAIGFGNEANTTPGGSGTVYFDDIRLYPSRCLHSKRSASFAKADYAPAGVPAGDCVVDHREMALMTDGWLFGTISSTADEIWREAESADTMSPPLQIWSDMADASGGQYIAVEPGNSSGDNPPSEGVATYVFTVKGGTYKILGRVIAPSATDDSFWCRIEGATTQTTNHPSGWIWWDVSEADGSNWHWDELNSDNDGDQTVQFTMAPGRHTLEVAYREDGALLDRLLITDNLNLNQADLPPRAADVNIDDMIDFEDFAIVAEHWLEEQLWPQP